MNIYRKILCLLSYRLMAKAMPDLASKDIILTFDDGPHPIYTEKILDLLKSHDIKAVFFVVGKNAQENNATLSRIIAEGHKVGNHTYSHIEITSLDKASQNDQIDKCQNVISSYVKYKIFRPPMGIVSIRSIIYLIKHHYHIILWNIDSKDYSSLSCTTIVDKLRERVKKKNIVLFHDDSALCYDVLEQIIPFWRSNGLIL